LQALDVSIAAVFNSVDAVKVAAVSPWGVLLIWLILLLLWLVVWRD